MYIIVVSGLLLFFTWFKGQVVAKKTEVERAWDEITSGKLSKTHQNNTP